MKVTLIIPTFNELDGMKAIMPKINKQWYHQLIIVDGGSTDGTIEYAQSQNYFVHIQKNPGIRNAYTELLPHIKGDVVVTFSPDGNSIPELIPQLVDKMRDGFDMVIVSRYYNGAQSYDDDIVTAFGNWFFTKTINLLYGARYTDAMVIFRAYKTKLIYDLELHKNEGYATAERLFSTHISWEPLLSVRAAKRKLKIDEIPGDEPARIGGERKLQAFKWGGAYYFQFIREIFRWC
jgi:glycosyltransferase involved in cell wall biosynthesis